MRELPMLDTAKCNGCGESVVLCPVGCLEQRGNLPWLVRPRSCIACTVCEVVCPVSAIRLKPLVSSN